MNLKPRIWELGNLGLGKIWQGAGSGDLARRAHPTIGAVDGLPPLPLTSDCVFPSFLNHVLIIVGFLI